MEATTRVTQGYLEGTIMIGEHRWTAHDHTIDETIYRTRNADVFYLKRVIIELHEGIFFRKKTDCKRYVEIYELTYDEAVNWTKKHLSGEAYDFYFVQHKTETNKWIKHYEEAKQKWELENQSQEQ